MRDTKKRVLFSQEAYNLPDNSGHGDRYRNHLEIINEKYNYFLGVWSHH